MLLLLQAIECWYKSAHGATGEARISDHGLIFRSRRLTRSAHEWPMLSGRIAAVHCGEINDGLVCEGGRTFVPRLRLASKTGQP